MKRIWPVGRFSIILGLLLLPFYAFPLLAADFSADVVQTLGGKVETYRIHVQQNRYMMERTEDGKQLRIIVDREKELTRIVLPTEKTYYEIPSNDLISLINDPFMAAINAAAKYQTRTIGKEKIQGFDCAKIRLHMDDTEIMTLWKSAQSLVPLKISHMSKTTRMVELKRLKAGAVDASLFLIPGDFKKQPHPMQKQRVPDPTKLSAVTGSVSGEAPWGRRVKAGGELRVKVDKQRKARVRVTNLLKSEAQVEVLPFNLGKQRENIGASSKKLEYKGSSFNREFNKDLDMFGSSFEVDEAVIRVSQGLVQVVVEQPGKEVRDLYNRGGVTTWERISPERATHLSMTGDNPDGASSSGEILVRNDKAKTQDKLPFELKNGETREWSFGADKGFDTLQISVPQGQGSMRIHIEQPAAAIPPVQTFTLDSGVQQHRVDPGRDLQISLTGVSKMNHFELKLFADPAGRQTIHEQMLSLQAGHSKTLDYPSVRGVQLLQITQLMGKAEIKLLQPPASQAMPTQAGSKPLVTSPPAQYQSVAPARMVLVLDASGSMWGQIEGKPKIAIAKEVMAGLIEQLPVEFQTGLTVYGHRRKGDCNDIEMLVPVGPHNASVMRLKVQGISPKGKTPLSDAVRQAAEALRYTEERASVVLVSDGLETCQVDPCALAEELAMSGVDFTVHVIGFDISKEEQSRLRCLADKTGGLFLAAHDAQALRDALLQTVQEVKAPPPPVVEDPGKAVLKGPASVPVGAVFRVEWKGPDSRGDYVSIAVKDDRDRSYVDYAYTKQGSPAELVAPGKQGAHELRYIHAHSGRVIGRADIAVTPIEAEVKPPASAPAAARFEVAWQGPAYAGDYITIGRAGEPDHRYDNYVYTREGNPASLQAPAEAGAYEVRYILGRGNNLLARAPITVEAASALVQPPEAVNAAGEFEVAWQGPDNEGDYISLAKPDEPAQRYDNYAYTHTGTPAKLTAPAAAGEYEVRYIQAKGSKILARAATRVKAVSAGVEPPASVNAAAEFQVAWQGPDNQGDYLTVVKPGEPAHRYDNYAYTLNGPPTRLKAPADAGDYEVRYIQAKGSKILAKAPIRVHPVSAKVAPPPSAKAGGNFQVEWQGPGYPRDYLTLVKPGEPAHRYDNYTYTRSGNPATLRAPETPGTYEVRYILDSATRVLHMTTIEIKP